MRSNLQQCRKRAGFKSARLFAERIGMSLNTYNNYEQGVSKLSLDRAWEFADILNCSLDELAGRDWPAAGGTACDGPSQRRLNDCYRLLDADSRKDLVGIAASFTADPSRLAAKSVDDAADDSTMSEF